MLASLVSLLACSKAAALRPTDAPRTTHQAATRRQSFAAAAATLLVPTAAIAATAEQVERAAKQGILKCFEKRDDKLVNVCKLQEIEELLDQAEIGGGLHHHERLAKRGKLPVRDDEFTRLEHPPMFSGAPSGSPLPPCVFRASS